MRSDQSNENNGDEWDGKDSGPIRPTHRPMAISPSVRLTRDAFAVRERLGDPRVVPSFHCPFLPGMPPSMSPGRSETYFSRLTISDMGLRQDLNDSALPAILPSASSRALISGLIDSPFLRPVRLLAPFDGSDRVLSWPRGLLHPGFQRVSHLSHCWTISSKNPRQNPHPFGCEELQGSGAPCVLASRVSTARCSQHAEGDRVAV